MSSNINKREFTDLGEIIDYEDGLAIKLRFGKALKRILRPLFGKELEVSFKLVEYQRSAAQNRWLWGVAYITIAAWYKETEGISVSKDAIHAYTLQHILGYKIATEEVHGVEVIYMKGKSTSNLTIKEFSQMKEDLQAYWSERGCYIPDPKEHNYLSEYLEDE